jgi:FXSXX-COOH protein
VSATIEEAKPITSKLDNFAGVSLADISTIDTPALDAAIGRVIPESHIKPVAVASFGSAI